MKVTAFIVMDRKKYDIATLQNDDFTWGKEMSDEIIEKIFLTAPPMKGGEI